MEYYSVVKPRKRDNKTKEKFHTKLLSKYNISLFEIIKYVMALIMEREEQL